MVETQQPSDHVWSLFPIIQARPVQMSVVILAKRVSLVIRQVVDEQVVIRVGDLTTTDTARPFARAGLIQKLIRPNDGFTALGVRFYTRRVRETTDRSVLVNYERRESDGVIGFRDHIVTNTANRPV